MHWSLIRATAAACGIEILLRFGFPQSLVAKLTFVSGICIAGSVLTVEVVHFFRMTLDAVGLLIESLGHLSGKAFTLLALLFWQFDDFKLQLHKRKDAKRHY